MTIHTVVLTASKRQGVAFGLDERERAVRIWLMTPRAVEIAMEKLEHLAGSLRSYAKMRPYDQERVQALSGGKRAREWDLK